MFLVKTRSLQHRNLCITWWNIPRLRWSLKAISNKQYWSKQQAWKNSIEVILLKNFQIWKQFKVVWVSIARWKNQRWVKASYLKSMPTLNQNKGYIFHNREKMLLINLQSLTLLSIKWTSLTRIIIDQHKVTQVISSRFQTEPIIQELLFIVMDSSKKQ